MVRARLPVLLLVAPLVVGCETPRRRPWEQAADGSSPTALGSPAPRPWAASSSSHLPAPSVLGSSGGLSEGERATDASPGEPGPATELVPAPPIRVGGPWVRCYGNFKLSGDPLKDVTRLGLLCGPENGMRRVSPQAMVGSVAENQAPVAESFSARRGDCYRVFAVAEATVADLDVTVRSSREAVIAADHGEDAWPIVQPDRPFCMLEDDTLTLAIAAHRGQGRFAAELWVLPRAEK